MNTPTAAALATAEKNAIKMYGYYTAERWTATSTNLFTCEHNENEKKAYAVCIEEGGEYCQCEYFRQEKTCKHIFFCREEARCDAADAAYLLFDAYAELETA